MDEQPEAKADLSEKFSSLIGKNKVSIAAFLAGLILIGLGVFMYKGGLLGSGDKVEILDSTVALNPGQIPNKKEIVVEVSGAVQKPGVYKLTEGDRVEDALIASGGISADADREWVAKFVNRAAKLIDGQKLYIAKTNEQSNVPSANNSGGYPPEGGQVKPDQGVLSTTSNGLINVNTASLSELDALPGIGQVYGQSIIDHRPYSDPSELLSKGALKQSVYDKVKDKVSVY
jgi:competence protein ComEA